MKPDLYGNHKGIIFILKQSDVFPVGVRGAQLYGLCYMARGGVRLEDYLSPGVLETSLSNTLRLQPKQKEGWC